MNDGELKQRLVTWTHEALSAARAAKVTTLAVVVGFIVWARIIVLQVRCLPLPISSHEQHHWRQSFTYGVAWNYAHVTLDFFRPRMYLELFQSNIVAMEAPIYPYLCGLMMRVIGDGTLFPRFIAWLAMWATVVVLFLWLGQQQERRETWSNRAGMFLALGVSICAAVDFRSIQPDPIAASLAIVAAYLFSRYATQARTRDLVLAAVLTSVAILTKPVVLGIVPALALFGVWRTENRVRHGAKVVIAVILAVVPHVLWDRWAAHLLATEMRGYIVISIQHDPKEILENLRNQSYAREALLHFLPNYAGSWWLVPAFIAGIYRALADRRFYRLGVPLLVWLWGYLTELLAVGDRLHSNAYYFVLGPAPVAFFAALGIGAVIEVLGSTSKRPPMPTFCAALIAFLTPLGALMLKRTDWKSVDVKALAFMNNKGVWTSELRLAVLLVGIVVALALAPRIRPPRVPLVLGLPLAALFLASVYPASQTSSQFLRFYSAIEERDTTRRDIADVRAAVDRYSALTDRVIIDPEEIVWLYYAGRNGFGIDKVKSTRLDDLRARDARLYLQLEDKPQHFPGKLLAKGAWWRLYCVAADNCPERR